MFPADQVCFGGKSSKRRYTVFVCENMTTKGVQIAHYWKVCKTKSLISDKVKSLQQARLESH